MDTSYVLLWFEAPLQSWGADSKFYRRNTMAFPTKSGVLGLVLCGMGATGPQRYFLQNFVDLKQDVYSFKKKSLKHQQIPLLEDFQMVGAGYNTDSPWESMLIPKTSEGKKSVGGGSKLSYKYYLQNAYFAVILEIPKDLTVTIERALTIPYYDIYLGRKNCIPTDFVFRGIYHKENAAKEKAFEIAESKELFNDFYVLDGKHDGKLMSIKDVPVQFGPVKQYVDRQVTVIKPEEIATEE